MPALVSRLRANVRNRNASVQAELVAATARRLRLDDAIADTVDGRVTSIQRAPMRLGLGSLFLNRVDVTSSTGQVVRLVEKGLQTTDPEVAFWRSFVPSSGFVSEGEHFRAVPARLSVAVKDLAVLYFPYVGALDRPKASLRAPFRADLPRVVSACAELNACNRWDARSPQDALGVRRLARRETVSTDNVMGKLGVTSRNLAEVLVRKSQEADRLWERLEDAYAGLPLCVCHNDVSPGNAIQVAGHTHLVDFGLVGFGPVGSDLHTVVRWSGRPLEDLRRAEGLLRQYWVEVRRRGVEVTWEQVRLATWGTFFLRYTDLRWEGARKVEAFCLALLALEDLADDLA